MSDQALVATRKGLFTLQHRRGKWRLSEPDFLGDNCSIAMSDPRDGWTYAALEHGHFGVKLHRKPPKGKWEECAAPSYPQQPEGETDRDGMGTPLPWSTVLIWELVPGGDTQDGVLWCGTIPGGLFRSQDRGASWRLNEALWNEPGRKRWFGGGRDLPGIHSILVDPRDADTMRIAVSCGGIWITHDGGESWKINGEGLRAEFMPPEQAYDPGIQDAHRLAQSAAHPQQLWVQHHNGIFFSRDGGKKWREIKKAGPSTFGFAAAIHPHDKDTAWFVPGIKDELRIPKDGKLVVTRTRDGGKSFDVLSRGLPKQHAYDIVFRHGLDVDDSGKRLIMGTTTGALFVSENEGTSWEEVSAHLPPIHCVRFC